MIRIRDCLFGTVSSIAVAGAAAAADMTRAPALMPMPVTSWAGWYIGIHGGVARHDFSIVADDEGSSLTGSKTGGLIGGHIGYNWQQRSFVYGFEIDGSWADTERIIRSGQFFNFPAVTDSKVDWLNTYRGRAGLAVDDTLVYVTGGLALAHVFNGWGLGYFLPSGTCCELSSSTTRVGWVGGGGIEHALGSGWIARAEVLYYDLGRDVVGPTQVDRFKSDTFQSEFTNSVVAGRLGLNLKW